jgi:hypothetical protein
MSLTLDEIQNLKENIQNSSGPFSLKCGTFLFLRNAWNAYFFYDRQLGLLEDKANFNMVPYRLLFMPLLL